MDTKRERQRKLLEKAWEENPALFVYCLVIVVAEKALKLVGNNNFESPVLPRSPDNEGEFAIELCRVKEGVVVNCKGQSAPFFDYKFPRSALDFLFKIGSDVLLTLMMNAPQIAAQRPLRNKIQKTCVYLFCSPDNCRVIRNP
ncbi:MAG: hypothetical protein ACOX2O_01455 [Bdellovibrionota bacterium]